MGAKIGVGFKMRSEATKTYGEQRFSSMEAPPQF